MNGRNGRLVDFNPYVVYLRNLILIQFEDGHFIQAQGVDDTASESLDSHIWGETRRRK